MHDLWRGIFFSHVHCMTCICSPISLMHLCITLTDTARRYFDNFVECFLHQIFRHAQCRRGNPLHADKDRDDVKHQASSHNHCHHSNFTYSTHFVWMSKKEFNTGVIVLALLCFQLPTRDSNHRPMVIISARKM